MSGGSYDYICYRVYDAADAILDNTPLRKAFVAHLRLVAKALHDLEWVDSADYARGDEEESIRECLSQAALVEDLSQQAEDSLRKIKQALEVLRGD